MASTFSSNKGYELMADGEESGTWGQVTNDNWGVVDLNFGGVVHLSFSSSSITLSASQAQNVVFNCTGALSANVSLIFPAGDGGFFIVRNATSGAFTLTVTTSSGDSGRLSQVIPQGGARFLWTDTNSVLEADTSASLGIATLGTMASQNYNAVSITGGSLTSVAIYSPTLFSPTIHSAYIASLVSPIQVAQGGTGATDVATARAVLQLGSAALYNTGTFGATVPLLNQANDWSNIQRFFCPTTNQPGVGNDASGVSLTHYSVFASSATTNAAYYANINTLSGGEGAIIQFRFRGNTVANIKVTEGGSRIAYSTGSDYRLKENISDLPDVGWVFDEIRPRQFDWKAGGSGVGFVAHELQEIVPSAISGEKDAVDENGEIVIQQIDKQELIPYLVREIQALRARVAELEANITNHQPAGAGLR